MIMKINHTFRPRQNKPNQTQFVVCPPDAQMDVNLVKTRDCNNEQRTMNYELLCKTNPNKPNFKRDTLLLCTALLPP
jgi:hypothetical protein